jgi:hypothetical protein
MTCTTHEILFRVMISGRTRLVGHWMYGVEEKCNHGFDGKTCVLEHLDIDARIISKYI